MEVNDEQYKIHRKCLWNDCVQLHTDLQEFRFLFNEKKERVELMNKTARSFFGSLQKLMWQSIFLKIFRLTEKKRTAGKDNLTLQSLAALAPSQDLDRVKRLVAEAVEASSFALEQIPKWCRVNLASLCGKQKDGASL